MKTIKVKTKSSPSTVRDNSSLYEAIVNNEWKKIRSLLKNKNVNDPVVTTGPLSGYTALHIACLGTDHQLVELFLRTYKPDVNVVADDGTQPIHLVCLLEPPSKFSSLRVRRIQALLKANANANSEIHRETFLKFIKDKEWCPDFGDKMTLLTYAIIYKLEFVAEKLLLFNANFKIISLTNKTLLMYAIYNDLYRITTSNFVLSIDDPDFINHRDNDGISTIHYLFHPKKFGKSRYDSLFHSFFLTCRYKSMALFSLNKAGGDNFALINNDPSTFIVNIAAYTSCPSILAYMSCGNFSMPLSRALYYATIPGDENSNDYFYILPQHDRELCLSELRERRNECLIVIIKDLINRRIFGLPVPKEELQLLDRLIVTDQNVKNIVNSYQKNFIEEKLKKRFIIFSEQKLTLFDFFVKVFDNKKLKLLVKAIKDKEQLKKAWSETFWNDSHPDYEYFRLLTWNRINYFYARHQLLQKIIKLSHLTEAIPLAFELILEIIDYVPNKYLDSLIKAFINSESFY